MVQTASGPVGLGATEIARAVRAGELSATEVLAAHLEQIVRVDGRLNAVVVRLFDSARAEAVNIDRQRRAGEPLGPLAGVPVTIKECFDVAGTPSTMGLRRFANHRAATDSPLVTRLRRAGALILGKTNVPQLMLMHETDNGLYGRTNNPWALDRSPGGSSGGEAAIIAALGSALGLASDMGGSIRQPAHACGICGLKPTSGRLPMVGVRQNFAGMEALNVQPGPLARRVADLRVALEVLASEPWEASTRTPPVPLGDASAVALDRLRIGFWTHDGYFAPSPAIVRAVHMAVRALEAAGAEVVPFEPPPVEDGMRLYFQILSADGGASARRLLSGERPSPQLARLFTAVRLPAAARQAVAGSLAAVGQRRAAALVRHTGPLSTDRYWRACWELRHYAATFLEQLAAANIDLLLLPPHALPALRHGSFRELPSASSPCVLANLLGLPAGVLPVTCVGPNEESDRPRSREWSQRMARRVELGSAGLPVGVQIVGQPWREDQVLAAMAALEQRFAQAGTRLWLPPGF